MGATGLGAAHAPPLPAGIEDVPHVLFVCPLLGLVRARFPDLFSAPAPSLCEFMQQDPVLLSAAAADCQRVHAAAASERAAAAGGEANRFPLWAQPAWSRCA